MGRTAIMLQRFACCLVFWYSLLRHQCIFATFLGSCLCPENNSTSFPWNHASTTAFGDSSSANWDHEDEIWGFWTDNSHYEPDLDCRQRGSVEEIHSREQLAVQQVTCELGTLLWRSEILNDNFPRCFWLMTSYNLNIISARYWPILVFLEAK